MTYTFDFSDFGLYAAVIAHGTNNAGNGRMTLFSMNPLYRADPEREWPMVGTSAYWIDQG